MKLEGLKPLDPYVLRFPGFSQNHVKSAENRKNQINNKFSTNSRKNLTQSLKQQQKNHINTNKYQKNHPPLGQTLRKPKKTKKKEVNQTQVQKHLHQENNLQPLQQLFGWSQITTAQNYINSSPEGSQKQLYR